MNHQTSSIFSGSAPSCKNATQPRVSLVSISTSLCRSLGRFCYTEPRVACRVFCSTSSPLMKFLPLHRSPVAVGHGCYCLALLRSVPAAAYIVLVTVLRYHLFIWSVFSPKLLYESMHLLLTAGICLFFIMMEQTQLK